MKKSNIKPTKSITLYQVPLFYRVLTSVVAIALMAQSIWYAITEGHYAMIVMYLALDVILGYIAFRKYYRLDVKANKFASCGFIIKEKVDLDDIVCIKLAILDTVKHDGRIPFTVNIQHKGGYVRCYSDWSSDWRLPESPIYINDKLQIKRLQKFCDKCNQYLNSRQK